MNSPNSLPSALVPSGEMTQLLKSIRRIVRASDLGSRSLQKSSGLTAPQLAVLTAIAALGEVSTKRIAEDVDLSAATVVTIIDNLERHGLVTRHRSNDDRRIVYTRLTEAAAAILSRAHGPFGESFAARLAALPAQRRRDMLEHLAALADLMNTADDQA
jgi:DNA-binding MarR family transcriptional regulator